MIQALLAAVGLMLVIEGIMPFLNPDAFRTTMLRAAQMDDRSLRIMGFLSMATGLIVLYLFN